MPADIGSTLASWSTTEASNAPNGSTTIGGGLDENLRMIQAVVRQMADTGTIASATTTDLSTVANRFITVSGTTTITGLGTLSAGMSKWLTFSGALILTHHATALILPGAANIATAAGDCGLFESLGAGNWKCLTFSSGAPFDASNLSDVADAAKGDALIGVKSTLTGAASRTQHSKNGDFVTLSDFTGTYTQQWQSAVAAGVTGLYVDASGTITAQIDIPANMYIFGQGRTVTKGFNGDMFTLAGGASVDNLKLSGAGATYTGRGFVISTGNDQKLTACNSTDMNGYSLEFTADSVGLRFQAIGGVYQRTTATSPAIKLPGAALETNGDRDFIGVQAAGGNLIDTSGSQNTLLQGCQMANMTFGANGLKTKLIGCRVASAGATLNVLGQDHVITGCVLAGNLDLNSGAANCRVAANVYANTYGAADSSGGNTNYIEASGTFTPVWKGTTDPVVGNGAISGRWARDGRRMSVSINLTMGSTTTYGTGAWYFQMPAALAFSSAAASVGVAKALDSGTAFHIGTSYLSAGAVSIYIVGEGAASSWQSTIPHTWASTDNIQIEIEYEIG